MLETAAELRPFQVRPLQQVQPLVSAEIPPKGEDKPPEPRGQLAIKISQLTRIEKSLTRTIVGRNGTAVSLISQSIADLTLSVIGSTNSIKISCTAALYHGRGSALLLLSFVPPKSQLSNVSQASPPKIDKRRCDVPAKLEKRGGAEFRSPQKNQASRSSLWRRMAPTANRE